MRRLLKAAARFCGWQMGPLVEPQEIRQQNPDITDAEWEIWCAVQQYTMTSLERILAVVRAVKYIVENHIPGDIVECGVWRGGSSMAIAHALVQLGDVSRRLYLYDTFDGMTDPTGQDMDLHGIHAAVLLGAAKEQGRVASSFIWAHASLEDVEENLGRVQYPGSIRYVKGPVEKTIPGIMPGQIALLRLDTDWYASTRHELTHLYPRLSQGGILIIDDYGHWQGARKAVDEYFAGRHLFLNRIDYTARLAVKPLDHIVSTVPLAGSEV